VVQAGWPRLPVTFLRLRGRLLFEPKGRPRAHWLAAIRGSRLELTRFGGPHDPCWVALHV